MEFLGMSSGSLESVPLISTIVYTIIISLLAVYTLKLTIIPKVIIVALFSIVFYTLVINSQYESDRMEYEHLSYYAIIDNEDDTYTLIDLDTDVRYESDNRSYNNDKDCRDTYAYGRIVYKGYNLELFKFESDDYYRGMVLCEPLNIIKE